ncbi:MAG: hypothetical protein R8J41_10385 [Alphaproteobacteria bacterium]|nr:hypothetical protein [Alphaproteobacteria bacterium]
MFRKVLTFITLSALVVIGFNDASAGTLTPLGIAIGWFVPGVVDTMLSHDSLAGAADTPTDIWVWLLNQPALAVFAVLFFIVGVLPATSNGTVEFQVGGSTRGQSSSAREQQRDDDSGGGFFGGDGDGGGGGD